MGIDIKTLGKVNLPVYAAADGYIARIKIEPAGFGQAIYIYHPNGFTTLYAHLNSFAPTLQAYIKRQQYILQSWNVFLDIPPALFKVKKGDLIAYSGSTGGSQAPHVHFEIRRTSDDVNVNPMLFGFPITDLTKPSILRLALYDRTKSFYEQTPRYIPIKKVGEIYQATVAKIISASPLISLAITSYDTHTGSTNQNGIYQGWLYDNDKAICHFTMDNISYDYTRYLNAHIDYKTKFNRGPYLQQLSELPGYIHSIYNKQGGDGVLNISDGQTHRIRIESNDTYGNRSVLHVDVQYSGSKPAAVSVPGKMFYPLMMGVSENEECEFFIGENCLYDSVHIRYAQTLSGVPDVISKIHTIGPAYIPLQEAMVVRIKPTKMPDEASRSKVVMQMFSGNEKQVQKVEWSGDWASARFREFGSFQLVVDKEGPEIIPIGFTSGANLKSASSIMFTCKDNLGKFKRFRAELDGKWLMFSNDKGRTFIYRFDENCSPGEHELQISVEDEAGNRTIKQFTFTR
ncbi:MAG: M23 family metallopeptidase [Chitinophagaceae bacterium]